MEMRAMSPPSYRTFPESSEFYARPARQAPDGIAVHFRIHKLYLFDERFSDRIQGEVQGYTYSGKRKIR
ncbi:hypothetical protein J6590_062695 [Homalodisca vitripennis]|nr:hypothetical protein J6590_062695 [Homalodisca vitripennis]